MNNLELCYMPATEMIRQFKARKISPLEVMQAIIDRAESTEPVVNALSHRFFDTAMNQAKKAQEKYARGKRTRALEGLPVGIKDETEVKDMPCTSGSLTRKDYIADRTSANNQRIMRAGGILHARTTTPEFSCAGYTHSKLWGITRNPWNPAFTSGGSSGGASASLASGTSSVATGSDIGGSIRIPASATGLVGYKPPYGRNPEDPPFNLDQYCHTGPLARNVSDTILLQNVMCGPHDEDIASLKPKLVLPASYKPIRGWKIAFSMDLGIFEVDTEVQKNTLHALDVFRSLGASVEEVDLGWTDEILRAGMDYLDHIFGVSMAGAWQEHGDLLTNYAKQFAVRGSQSTAEKFYRSLEVTAGMYQTFGPLFRKYDLFVCPTNALAAVAAEHDQSRDPVFINGKTVDPLLGWVLTLPFNMMSRCPVISMPSGRTRDNVPTGIQLVGPTYQDKIVFRAAMAFENEVGQWYTHAENRPEL